MAKYKYGKQFHGTGLQLDLSEDFMEYDVDNGFLLGYAGDIILAELNRLADLGLDSNGKPFAKYKSRSAAKVDKDGNIVRNEKGQWEKISDGGSSRRVTLRSLDDVPPGKRLRENIKRYPVVVNKETKRVTLQSSGGRKDDADSPRRTFSARLKSAQGLDPEVGGPDRDFLSVSNHVSNLVFDRIMSNGVLGFITKENERANAREVEKAIKLQRRAEKELAKKARMEERAANAAHRAEVRKAKEAMRAQRAAERQAKAGRSKG